MLQTSFCVCLYTRFERGSALLSICDCSRCHSSHLSVLSIQESLCNFSVPSCMSPPFPSVITSGAEAVGGRPTATYIAATTAQVNTCIIFHRNRSFKSLRPRCSFMSFKNLSWGKGAADQTDLLLVFLGVQNVFYEMAAIHFSYTQSRYI